MGQEICRAIQTAPDLELVGGVDPAAAQRSADLAGSQGTAGPAGSQRPVEIVSSAEEALARWPAHVWVDFTVAAAARRSIPLAIEAGAAPVVGTTGLDPAEIKSWELACESRGLGAAFIPNFSVGAWLLEECVRRAATLLPQVEVVEMHHPGKKDAPSGTALRLAGVIASARRAATAAAGTDDAGGGGGTVPIHSIRLPGLLAHHEVLFGQEGETLLLRHDVYDRRAFMPTLLLAIRRVAGEGLVARGLGDILS